MFSVRSWEYDQNTMDTTVLRFLRAQTKTKGQDYRAMQNSMDLLQYQREMIILLDFVVLFLVMGFTLKKKKKKTFSSALYVQSCV